jgi:aromatic ring-opening dioxygenase catalytic subunit (LigB family)
MTLVGAFACSHAALMVTRRDACDAALQQQVYAAFTQVGERIAALEADVVVVFGTDHGRNFTLEHVPAFTIGIGAVAHGMGDGGLPQIDFPVDQPLAAEMLTGALAADVDLAFSEDMKIDHSFVTPLMLAFGAPPPTVVPVTQNCAIPPRPTLARSFSVGRTLGQIAAASSRRVAVIGTGGLSHWVGSQERRDFMNRPPGTRIAELSQYPVTIADTGSINQDFDRELLSLGEQGRWEEVLRWSPESIESSAGNGAQEIRNWIAAAGFADGAPLKSFVYTPVPEWLTGTAVAEFDLSGQEHPGAAAQPEAAGAR